MKTQILEMLDREIQELQQARALIAGDGVPRFEYGRAKQRRGRRHMSAEARARISAAQKARWAKVKAKKK